MSKNELRFPKLMATKDQLTAAAGLGTLMELFGSSELKKEFIACLPERSSSRSAGSYLLALATMV